MERKNTAEGDLCLTLQSYMTHANNHREVIVNATVLTNMKKRVY